MKKILALIGLALMGLGIHTAKPHLFGGISNNSYDCTQPIPFEINDDTDYPFHDALFSPANATNQTLCESKSNADIQQMERDRFNTYTTFVNSLKGGIPTDIEVIDDQIQ